MTDIQQRLFAEREEKYREFSLSLIPTVDPERVIGVRTPKLRLMARELIKSGEWEEFVKTLPHKYYEEDNLHAYILCELKDKGRLFSELDRFLPFVDNWATCDTITPKAFRKNIPDLYEKIKVWLKSGHTYTIRFGVNMLMKFFLDENFSDEVLLLVAEIKSEEYYVNMVRAWFFATAMAKQRGATLPYLEKKKLDKWTHNKTIQKCTESYRISDKDKVFLKEMKL